MDQGGQSGDQGMNGSADSSLPSKSSTDEDSLLFKAVWGAPWKLPGWLPKVAGRLIACEHKLIIKIKGATSADTLSLAKIQKYTKETMFKNLGLNHESIVKKILCANK